MSESSGRAAGRYVYECPLRWSDMDAFGHVNNAHFLTLYEEARVAMMFTGARGSGLDSLEQGIVIARNEVDYLRPVDHATGPGGVPRPPTVRIEMWIELVRPSKFVVAYELYDGDALAGRARSVCVPFDLDAGKPRRLSDAEREYLSHWLLPDGGAPGAVGAGDGAAGAVVAGDVGAGAVVVADGGDADGGRGRARDAVGGGNGTGRG